MEFTAKAAGFAVVVNIANDAATKAIDKSFDGGGKITLIADQNMVIAESFGGRVGAKVSANDLTIDQLNYKCQESGSVTVEASALLSALTRFSLEPDQGLSFKTEQGKDANQKDLVISKEDDSTQLQALPCLPSPVELPKLASSYDRILEMNRSDFMYGCEKIFFSIGFESDKQRYLYWIMRTEKDSIRFVAGTGAIFACLGLSRKDIAKASTDKMEFMFHKDHTPVVNKILSLLKNDNITIKGSDNGVKDAPYQIVISSTLCDIILVGMNPDLNWPDEKKLFDADYDYHVVTGIKDWTEAGLGVVATFQTESKKERKPHIAKMLFDFVKKQAAIENADAQRTKCVISLLDYTIDSNKTLHWKDTEIPSLTCMSTYLCEVPKRSAEGNVQIEFSVPSKPILITYYAGDKVAAKNDIKKDHAGTDERFSVLFATMNV